MNSQRNRIPTFLFGVLVGVSLGILLVGFTQRAMALDKTYGDVQGVVVSNHDGDTIKIDIPGWPDIIGKGIPVRVSGIDTPEMNDPDQLNRRVARQAGLFVTQICPAGSLLYIKDSWRGKYFRIGGTVSCNGVDVAKKLIEKGLATPYDGKTKTKWVGGKPYAIDRGK